MKSLKYLALGALLLSGTSPLSINSVFAMQAVNGSEVDFKPAPRQPLTDKSFTDWAQKKGLIPGEKAKSMSEAENSKLNNFFDPANRQSPKQTNLRKIDNELFEIITTKNYLTKNSTHIKNHILIFNAILAKLSAYPEVTREQFKSYFSTVDFPLANQRGRTVESDAKDFIANFSDKLAKAQLTATWSSQDYKSPEITEDAINRAFPRAKVDDKTSAFTIKDVDLRKFLSGGEKDLSFFSKHAILPDVLNAAFEKAAKDDENNTVQALIDRFLSNNEGKEVKFSVKCTADTSLNDYKALDNSENIATLTRQLNEVIALPTVGERFAKSCQAMINVKQIQDTSQSLLTEKVYVANGQQYSKADFARLSQDEAKKIKEIKFINSNTTVENPELSTISCDAVTVSPTESDNAKKYEAATATIATQLQTIESLNAEITNQKQTIATLNTEKAVWEGKHNSLQEQCYDLEEEKEKIEARKNIFEGAVRQLATDFDIKGYNSSNVDEQHDILKPFGSFLEASRDGNSKFLALRNAGVSGLGHKELSTAKNFKEAVQKIKSSVHLDSHFYTKNSVVDAKVAAAKLEGAKESAKLFGIDNVDQYKDFDSLQVAIAEKIKNSKS